MKQNLRRIELLDFVSRDFSEYAWSLRTPDRRLDYSGIKYTDQSVQVDEVEEALKQELEGPGKLLGYRALHKKLRQVHELNVPRDLVYVVMYNVDPDALAERAPQVKKATFTDLNIQQHHLSLTVYMRSLPDTAFLIKESAFTLSHMLPLLLIYLRNVPSDVKQ